MRQSLENQVCMAEKYIAQDDCLKQFPVRIFLDEGYSGTTLNRPQFQKMLAAVYEKKVAAVVVKDLSRLSRNHLFLCEFVEKTVLENEMILVSLGENYDSRKKNQQELSLGFQTIFYEYYCRDVSRKVKQSLEAKKQGESFSVARVPYGYRKKTQSQTVYIVPEEARVVCYIYSLAAKGYNTVFIAKELNEWDVTKEKWEASQVWRILHNPVYEGNRVWHKYENVYYNGFLTKMLPRQQWEMRPKEYPAIISAKLAQDAKTSWKPNGAYGKSKGPRHIFSGITKCRECGIALCRHRQKKEILQCKKCKNSIDSQALFQICEKIIYGTSNILAESNTEEKRMFLHFYFDKICVDGKGSLWVYVKYENG